MEYSFTECDYLSLCLFNNGADWPIPEQGKFRQESKTDNDGTKKNGSEESPADAETGKMGISY